MFRWGDPPGGHPVQAHNCRCWAEPIAPGGPDVILADFTPEAPVDESTGLRPLTPAGRAALPLLGGATAGPLIQRLADQAALGRGFEVLGADRTTVEGVVGSWAYAHTRRRVTDGLPFDPLDFPKRRDDAEIVAQAAGLFAMPRRDLAIAALSGRPDAASFAMLRAFLGEAPHAYREGRLILQPGDLAEAGPRSFPA